MELAATPSIHRAGDRPRIAIESPATTALRLPRLRAFLMHVLPKRFHRIRCYGLFANAARAQNIARARELLSMVTPENKQAATTSEDDAVHTPRCPCCGGRMIIIETFEPGSTPRTPPTIPILAIGIDSS